MSRFQIYAGLAVVFVIMWAVAVTTISRAQPGRIDEDFTSIPKHVGSWQGENMATDTGALQVLSTTSILSRHYTNEKGDDVTLSVVYGRELADFHTPEVCMAGAGWKEKSKEIIWLQPKGLPRHQAVLLHVTSDYEDGVMVYWYYMNGKLTPDLMGSKTSLVLKSACGIKLKPSVMAKFMSTGDSDVVNARKKAEELSELLTKAIVQMAQKKPKYIPINK